MNGASLRAGTARYRNVIRYPRPHRGDQDRGLAQANRKSEKGISPVIGSSESMGETGQIGRSHL
jgi:hypothetical protein